jgi:D-beta-D-heptose 7-phosphate kinase / D-beta-D-heptose 1-phosphate adenosyltransferase
MNSSLSGAIGAFPNLKVGVIGDVMLDSYLRGSSERLSQEAPVPIVAVAEREDAPGGAANTAANVRALGGQVTLLSVVGDDPEGAFLRSLLQDHSVRPHDILKQPFRRTLVKQRVISDSHMLIRFDQGSTDPIEARSEDQLLDLMPRVFSGSDAVVASDYGYGVCTERIIGLLAELQARTPRVLVIDSKNLAAYRQVRPTAVKPNYAQAVQLLSDVHGDTDSKRAERLAVHGERLLDLSEAQIAVVTLDTEGALIFERDKPSYRTYARPTTRARGTGAGDTFASALTLALAAGADVPAAGEIASAAAAVVVAKEGTALCTSQELVAHLSPGLKYAASLANLVGRVECYRQQGLRIIFTNGCFDILHRGHVTYLNRAKALGDVLIVGVNSDPSVQRLKGHGRPINTLEDRLQVLAALSCVDHLVAFEQDTPHDLIAAIRPDVFVKGGDYTREALPEAALVEQLGGVVQILPYLDEYSTTDILDRIRDVGHSASAEPRVAFATNQR